MQAAPETSKSSAARRARGPWRRIRETWRPGPAERYVHPKAIGIIHAESDHDANLDVAEDNAPNYLQWIADRCRPYLGKRVLEVGAGTGSITARYADGREVLAIERSPWCIEQMRQRFADSPNVTIRHTELEQLEDEGQRFDSIVLLNVLEHIQDDVAALQGLKNLLSPGGRIVLYVPALNAMYGRWDRKVGHWRRYAPWRMRQVLAAAGLRPVQLRYMNILTIPGWWIFSHSNFEKSSAGQLSLWDKVGIPVGRKLESLVPVPIGLNVFCVAEIDD